MAKTRHISIMSLALIFLATGCIVRTYTVVKDRPDLELTEGNQGYLQGTPSETPTIEKTTRNTYVAEVEMGKPYEERVIVEQYRKDNANKKAFKQKKVSRKTVSLNETIAEEMESKSSIISDEKDLAAVKDKSVVVVGKQSPASSASVSEKKVAKVKTYVVKSGETLEKIAARPEIYGDKKKWYKIYKANEGQLKEPNKIFPGQVLNIPE